MTFQADYQVVFIDPVSLYPVEVIPSFRMARLQYRRVINDVGIISITLSGTDRAAVYAYTDDLIIEVYRRNAIGQPLEKEETYLLRMSETFADESGNDWIIFMGESLNTLLKRRIIDPQDDPNSAGGYLSYADDCATVMNNLVRYQCIEPQVDSDRIIDGLTFVDQTGGEDVFVREVFGRNLFEVLREIRVEGDIDFRINRLEYPITTLETIYTLQVSTREEKKQFQQISSTTLNAFEFVAGKIGTDKTVTTNLSTDTPYIIFNPQRGNIFEPRLTIDARNEITVAYVMGQGPENDREILEVENTTRLAATSRWGRIEDTTDARNTDTTSGLETSGLSYLDDNRVLEEFAFKPNLGNTVYNIDWTLGDMVSAQYRNTLEDLRIEAVEVDLEDGVETIEIELTNE